MGRVLQMYESEAGHMLSNAELEAMAWNEVMCYDRKKRGKCTRECISCPYGEGHALMNSVDPFQRMVINDRADRHIMSTMRPPIDIGETILGVISAVGCIFMLWFFWKVGRLAQWW
ncbi:MAG: hypothetical protein J6Y13_01635 [Treponema sp.]|nr:hypothetical protein [Treponema sp.]